MTDKPKVKRETDLVGDIRYYLYWQKSNDRKPYRVGSASARPPHDPDSTDCVSLIDAPPLTAYLYTITISRKYRGRGWGLWFLRWIMKDLLRGGSHHLMLVDISDRRGKEDCIYRKVGLQYIGTSKMLGDLRSPVEPSRICSITGS